MILLVAMFTLLFEVKINIFTAELAERREILLFTSFLN